MNENSIDPEQIRVLSDTSDLEDKKMLERAESLINDARSLGCIAALQKHDHNVNTLRNLFARDTFILLAFSPPMMCSKLEVAWGNTRGKLQLSVEA